ncbi:pectate lyase [Catellatospora sp. NPDC049609]|uniref:pectate lyase family protein n=1 Tax=Catellatospora sp. NPDC049609 TaxID=3155505 RepID=UPI00342349DD
MKRTVAWRLSAALATTTAAAAIGVALSVPQASAATGGVTGYATQNGGTTGGAGGQTVQASTGTAIHTALCNRASSSTPIIIQVSGTINHGNTAKVSGNSCNTADGVIELKEISNVSIIGVGSGAVFDQLGIHIRDSSNIIIQNVTIRNVKKSGSPTSNGGDAIGMESTVRNVWVDHVTLEASGGESEGFDGLFDMKNDVEYVTLSYSILRNSGRGGLIGSSETDTGNNYITFHHNLYSNIDSRTPLLRGGIAHIYNNHYVNLHESGINSRAGGRAKVDNNYFKDSKDVLGTFYTSEAGYWQVSGNIFDNVTWSSPGSDNNPAGPNVQSNTSVSIPYSYPLDAASCVPSVVAATAGANKGLQVSNGSCTPVSPSAGPSSPAPSVSPSRSTAPSPSVSPSASPSTSPSASPSQPSGTNLSRISGAGADGSSKVDGTSYGNVKDGSLTTYWQPTGATGDISVKWGSAVTVSRVVIREPSGTSGSIGSWQLINYNTGAVLKTGSGAGTITFTATSLTKITFRITSSSGAPRVGEFETYAS